MLNHPTSPSSEMKQTDEGLVFQSSLTPAQRKRNLFTEILKEEFLRELQFLSDVMAGRAKARDTFTQQLVAQVNKVASLDPSDISSTVVSTLGDAVDFAVNRDRNNRMSIKLIK